MIKGGSERIAYDVIVVGAGIMGCSAAYNLSKKGKKVLLIEQFTVKGAFNQSQDHSRFFRYAYGDPLYTKLAMESLKLWKALERESGTKLYFKGGLLSLCKEDGNNTRYSIQHSVGWGSKISLEKSGRENVLQYYLALKKLGLKAELLEKKELNRRFPQFDASFGLLDPSGGVLSASAAIDVFVALGKKRGLKVREESRVIAIADNCVLLEHGEKIYARKIVVTAGFWINKLFGGRYPIKTTRQEVLYIKPKNQSDFKIGKFPLFSYMEGDHFYGIPMHGINAVKVAVDSAKSADPQKLKDSGEFKSTARLRKLAKYYIPKLANGKILEKKLCMYDISPDEDFIIDQPNSTMIVATGFSGHGFKFAPLIGRILADLAIYGSTKHDISRFSMKRFGKPLRLGIRKKIL
ncbi:MAG: N-methyl-L-tryptophan oxidase [Candidatus Micrarchaeota archaeon]|nr:N-methyl-L-tryptophan oxidase [Candidatus Micrarchaeota archaeon]MDE1864400.1 N-methyl-L-tryptophan oxidase [Candidatus Micrarchaeota archaeon]